MKYTFIGLDGFQNTFETQKSPEILTQFLLNGELLIDENGKIYGAACLIKDACKYYIENQEITDLMLTTSC